MKFSTDKKKRKIEKRLWKMLIEISQLRSNGRCEYPKCNNNGEQRDHCFSASKSPKLRFDYRNISNLCGFHHSQKSFCCEGSEKVVDAMVKLREGVKAWEEMTELAKHDGLFKWNILTLEEKEKEIQEQLNYWRIRTE